MSAVQSLNSCSVKKFKFKVVDIKSFNFVEDLHYIYLASDSEKIVLLLKAKDFEAHSDILQVDSFVLCCRLSLMDTINCIPVFQLEENGRSVIKPSKLAMKDCLVYGSEDILAMKIKISSLHPKLQNITIEDVVLDNPKLSLMDFLTLDRSKINSNQFVEVVVLASYINRKSEDKAFCKTFVSSRDGHTFSTIQMWLDDAPAIAALKDDEKLKQKTVLLIKADHLRSKLSSPLNAPPKAALNSAVLRDRGFATDMLKFKNPTLVIDDEALRKTGNLELKKEFFDNSDLVKRKETISSKEFASLLRIRANNEESGSPSPGNAALYLYESERVGLTPGETSGRVFIDGKTAEASIFLMPGVMQELRLLLEPAKRYLILLCFLKDAVMKNLDREGSVVLKVEFIISADEEYFEDLELSEIDKKRPVEDEAGPSKSKKQ